MKSVKLQITKWSLVVFLSTNNYLLKKEIKTMISFTISLKTIKYSGINLTNVMKVMYIESIRYWWKKMKKKQINWKISCVFRSEVLILLACALSQSGSPLQEATRWVDQGMEPLASGRPCLSALPQLSLWCCW